MTAGRARHSVRAVCLADGAQQSDALYPLSRVSLTPPFMGVYCGIEDTQPFQGFSHF